MSTAVSGFTITSITATTITATWTVTTPGPIYPTYEAPTGPPPVYGSNIGPNGTTYTWTGLTPDSDYTVILLTANDGNSGNSIAGTETSVSTLPLVCFAEGTPVTTDQGQIPIEQINPHVNTIDNKRIVCVTKGTTDPTVVLLKKDCLGPNKPSQDTVLTLMHQVLYHGRMLQARDLPNRQLIPYDYKPVYNVELETLDIMMVNNLIVETAYPKTSDGTKLQDKHIKCLRTKCQFKRHVDIKNNGGTHCCLRCKLDGTHGDFCMRLPL